MQQLTLNDYVDLCCSETIWVVAKVTGLREDYGVRLDYRKNGSKQAEWVLPTSKRLAPFRTKSSVKEYFPLPLRGTQIQEFIDEAISGLKEPIGNCKEIIAFYRGTIYSLSLEVLQSKPSSREAMAQAVQFLTGCIDLTEAWLDLLPRLQTQVLSLSVAKEVMYMDESAALASIWPEMFSVIGMILDGSSQIYRSNFAPIFAEQLEVPALNIHFWLEGIKVKVVEKAANLLSAGLSQGDPSTALTLLTELPCWQFILKHIETLANERQCDSAVACLKDALEAWEKSPSITYEDYCKLQTLWEAVRSVRKYLGVLGYESEGELLLRPVLTLCEKLISHQSIEKRILAANFLEAISLTLEEDAVLTQSISAWVLSRAILQQLLSDLHPEVLSRCPNLFQWLHRAGLFPIDLLCSLFGSTASAHESYVDCVHSLISLLVPSFSVDDTCSLFQVIMSVEDYYCDKKTLQLIKQIFDSLPENRPETSQFALKVLIDLIQYIDSAASASSNGDLSAIYQICFDLQRLKEIREETRPSTALLFSIIALNVENFKPKLLYQFLETFKGDDGFIVQLISSLDCQIGDTFQISFLHLLNKYRAGQGPKEDIVWALKAFDLLACATYHHSTKESILTDNYFEGLCVMVCRAEGEMIEIQEEFLVFMVECANSSVWCNESLLLLLLATLELPKATSLLLKLNRPCYEALFRLFLQLNKSAIDFEDLSVLVVYPNIEIFQLSVFVRMAVFPRDQEIREFALKHANRLLTASDTPNRRVIDQFIHLVFALIDSSNDSSLHHNSLATLQSCIEYGQKYSTLLRDQEELMLCVRQHIQDAQSDPLAEGYDLQDYYSRNIAEYARKKNVQFMQVSLIKSKRKRDEFVRNYFVSPYSPADFRAVMSPAYRPSLIKVFSSPSFAVHQLALWVISALLPDSSLYSEISRLQEAYSSLFLAKLEERTFILLALKELSKKPDFLLKYAPHAGDLLKLLQLVSVPQTEMEAWVTAVQHRAVLYYEVLLHLVKTHFILAQKPIPGTSLIQMLAALEVFSVYLLIPGREKVEETNLLRELGEIVRETIKTVDCVAEIAETGYFPAFYQRIFLHKVPNPISQQAAELLKSLCQADSRFTDYFLEILLENVPKALENESTGYIEALSWLLKQPHSDQKFASQVGNLARTVRTRLLTVGKTAFGVNLWSIGESLLRWYREEEVQTLLQEAIRTFSSPEPVKYPQNAVLSFIEAVRSGFPSLESDILGDLSEFYRDISWRKAAAANWKLSPSSQTSSSARGFRNPGAICYINSAFQQLFAISTFAEGILAVNPDPAQSLLQNYQRIIAKMKFKPIGSISAEKILYCLREEPVNPTEQADIEEFFNEFLHKLNSELTEIGSSDLIPDHFQGLTETNLVGKQGCTHSRASTQPFLVLNVGIKGKRNLQASLEAFTKGELLTGANMPECDICAAKVPTESMQRVRHLPNVMVISLRRFEYSIEANRRYKLTEKFTFPMQINLKLIATEADLPESYYEYRLQGVIIHQGSAESGHYYSLVRTAAGWLKCNDEEVTDFDEKDIEKEAFGGLLQGKSQVLEHCAYLLVYVRDQHYRYTDGLDPVQVIPPAKPVEQAAAVQCVQGKYAAHCDINGTLARLLSPSYIQFVQKILSSPNLSAKSLIFALSYFLTIYVRKASYPQDHALLPALLAAIPKVPNIAIWTTEIVGNEGVIDELVLSAPIHVQKSMILIVKEVLEKASSQLIRHFLGRLIGKMETFKDCGVKEYAQFFEMMYYAVSKSPQDALELQLCERLVTKLIPCREDLGKITPKDPIFTPDSYLGHPFPEPYRPHLSNKHNYGFQLKILALLFPHLDHLQRYFVENLSVLPVNLLLLETEFELEQVPEMLRCPGADLNALLQMLEQAYRDRSNSYNELKLLYILPRIVVGQSLITTRVIHLLQQVMFPVD